MTNWAKIMDDNRDAIIEKMVEAYREACVSLQGWSIHVEINEDGEVYTTGLMSQHSQTMNSWEGKTCIVAQIPTWQPELNTWETIQQHEDLFAEFKSQREEGHEYVYDFMDEKYPEKLLEWEEESKDYEIDYFRAEQVVQMLDDNIEEERFRQQ